MLQHFPAAYVDEARAWLGDCAWQNVDREDIEELPAGFILRGVARHYDGGLVQFVTDTNA